MRAEIEEKAREEKPKQGSSLPYYIKRTVKIVERDGKKRFKT